MSGRADGWMDGGSGSEVESDAEATDTLGFSPPPLSLLPRLMASVLLSIVDGGGNDKTWLISSALVGVRVRS